MRGYNFWDHETDDAKLIQLHGQKHSDYRIAELMQKNYSTVRDHRRRLGLPSNSPGPGRQERDGETVATKADPLAAAQKHLPGFDRNRMTLRGQPIKLIDLMPLVNAELKEKGLDQILHNPAWAAP